MTLRRGFKSEANTTSKELRQELGLAADAPLCPFKTAEHLEVEVLKLSSYRAALPLETTYLMQNEGKIRFSAVTCCFGTERIIIYNDLLPPTRSHADIMHEIGHMLLMHEPHVVCARTGGRHYDADMEEEANWLGPALLVSEEAALVTVQRGLAVPVAAGHYKVSPSLMRMRLNVTGALRRVARAA